MASPGQTARDRRGNTGTMEYVRAPESRAPGSSILVPDWGCAGVPIPQGIGQVVTGDERGIAEY